MTGRDWTALAAAYEARGGSLRAFAREQGIPASTAWKHLRACRPAAGEDREASVPRRLPQQDREGEGALRAERVAALHDMLLTKLEQAAGELEGTAAEADKLSKLLAAAEKLDKLCPPEGGAAAIRVELGAAEEYAL